MTQEERKSKPEAIILNWHICYKACSSVNYVKGIKHLHGQFMHHHKPWNAPDASYGWTSEIIDMGIDWAETKHTMYTLENPAS